MNKLNNNNFLTFSGTFAGALFWTMSFSLEKNEVCLSPVDTDYYSGQTDYLKKGVALFTNEALSTPAPNGWYSNSIFKYQVVGGVITTVLNCEG